MTAPYEGATFWKCALQVNPWRYAAQYRGNSHGLTENEYNKQLRQVCLDKDIKALGIADHGRVQDIKAIQQAIAGSDIVVFPGFEIASSEQVHFVCLFPEDMDIDDLHSEMTVGFKVDLKQPELPVNMTASDIIERADKLGGLAYAAHITTENGVLNKRLHNIWTLPGLSAAQIPGSINDLKPAESGFYYKVVKNREPNYKRETPLAIINARDVEAPETLHHSSASCLIKMTKPCFASFKQAFLDPDSRIRLNSDVPQHYASAIEAIKVVGGYLDELDITIADHLNAVIGGRGTGKSTLIECIRFALNIRPSGKNAQRQHDETVRQNLGKEKAQIVLRVRSATMHGKVFTVSRRYGDSPVVKNENDELVPFEPRDLLPRIEIFGQNEIYEISQDAGGQRQLLSRFLDADHNEATEKLRQIRGKLADNRKAILNCLAQRADVEAEVERLPILEAKAKHYKALGLEEKLKIVPLLESEKHLATRVKDEINRIDAAIRDTSDALPDTAFLSDQALDKLPHAGTLRSQRQVLEKHTTLIRDLLTRAGQAVEQMHKENAPLDESLQQKIRQEQTVLDEQFKKIPESQGKSGREIGVEYQQLLQTIERSRPMQKTLEQRQAQLDELEGKRQAILTELGDMLSEHSAKTQRALKRLQRKLKGKLCLAIKSEGQRQPLFDFLMGCNLEGVGSRRLAWVKEADCSPANLAATIRQGSDALQQQGWSITPSTAEALAQLPASKILEMEEVMLPDQVTIELNVAHDGQAEHYRELSQLSTGQQCTAILHLLMLDNKDPLVLDQPEDNLDNAFIAERIVAELRKAKLDRQFLFATHNANIPVFGDAEWIGALCAEHDGASIPTDHQGAIDMPEIQRLAANILEGGRRAFDQRRLKYGF